jgi:hypothetical protein
MMTFAALGAAMTTLLPAQTSATPSGNRFIPENSSLVLRVASPAKLRKQFGQTQVAKLGESQSLAPIMDMLGQQLEMNMDMMRDSGMFDADLAEGLLNTWMGDIVVSVQVDWDGMLDAMDYGDFPPMSIVIALSSDGDFDLGAVVKEIDSWADREAPEGVLKDMIVGDLTMRRVDNGGDGPDVALPMMIDGHLVMLVGTSIEKDATKLISNEGRFTIQNTAPLFVHADIGRLISTMLEADSGEAPFDLAEMMDLIGIGALQHLSMSIKPDGTTVNGEMHLGLTKNNRGFFGMMPKGNQQPKLLGSIPPNSEAFSVSAMDLNAVMTMIQDVWGLAEDFTPMTFDDAMAMFTEATTVDLKRDLLDNIGKEFLTVQDADAMKNIDMDEIEDDMSAMFAGTVFGLALNDSTKFDVALNKIIRSRGMHVGRKTEAYANAEIHRMKLLGMLDLEYSVNNNLLLIGIGGSEGTSRTLRNIIDTRATGETQLPEILTKRVSGLAPGWNGIGITPIGTILEGLVMGMQATGEFGNEIDMATQITRGVVADMKRLGIGSIISAAYCDDSGYTNTFRW